MASPGAERPLGTDAGHTDSAADAVKEHSEKLSDRVTETADELKRQAEGAAHDIRDRAFSAADERQKFGGETNGKRGARIPCRLR